MNPKASVYFSKDYTILVDDCLQKSVLNYNRNVIFLESLDHHVHGDTVLMGTCAPWLKQLHKECQPSHLREYVNVNQIGQSPMTPSSYRTNLLLDGLRELAKNFRSYYVLLGMKLVIELE